MHRQSGLAFAIFLGIGLAPAVSFAKEIAEQPEPKKAAPLYELSRDEMAAAARAQLAETGRQHQAYAVGVMPPLSRIFRHGGPALTWTGPIKVSMARAELEHRELALIPLDGALENVAVSTTAFSRLDGQAKLQVSAGPVGFIRTPRRPEPKPEVDVGDALLEPQRFNVRSGELQSIYLLVETTPETPAGLYEGQVTIAPQGKTPTTLDVQVKVWDFELPKQPPLHGWCSTLAPDILMKHKIEPGWFSPKIDLSATITKEQWQQTEEQIQAWFAAGHSFLMIRTPGAPLNGSVLGAAGNQARPDYSPDQIRAMIAYWRGLAQILERLNKLDKAAVYVWDEPHYEKFSEMTEICNWVHEAHPRLKTCAAGWWDLRPHRDNGAIDIYCPITFAFEPAVDRSGRPHGSETWWYVCWVPAAPAPNVMVDNPPLQQRVMGWQSWRFGVSGFLYWETHRAMWDKLSKRQPPFTDCGQMRNGGDGTLIHNVDGGFVPSLRLRHLADGMEDLQYIQLLDGLLKQVDQQALDSFTKEWREVRKAARAALGEVGHVVLENQSEFSEAKIEGHTKEPARLLAARSDLAEAIVQLRKLCRHANGQDPF